MFESGKSCLDLAQQLHAVEKALATAKHALIHDHIDHCLDAAIANGAMKPEAALREFRALTKYL